MKFEIDDKTQMITFFPVHPLTDDGSTATIDGKKYSIHPPYNLESVPIEIKEKIYELLNLQPATSIELEQIIQAVKKTQENIQES